MSFSSEKYLWFFKPLLVKIWTLFCKAKEVNPVDGQPHTARWHHEEKELNIAEKYCALKGLILNFTSTFFDLKDKSNFRLILLSGEYLCLSLVLGSHPTGCWVPFLHDVTWLCVAGQQGPPSALAKF
jgi:hypothetical protein